MFPSRLGGAFSVGQWITRVRAPRARSAVIPALAIATLLVVACADSTPSEASTPAPGPAAAVPPASPTPAAAARITAAPTAAASPTAPARAAESTATPAITPAPVAPTGLDFGDAPTAGDAGYPGLAVAAAFPSGLAADGARLGVNGQDSLGPGATTEADAIAANADESDDGISALILDLASAPAQASVVAHVTLAADAPAGPRFLNVLLDLNADGQWQGDGAPAEWVVRNHEVAASPGETQRVAMPPFTYGDESQIPTAAWMRVVMSRQAIDTSGWSGTGALGIGEVEDYLVRLDGTPAPVIQCPSNISLAGTFLRGTDCTLTNLAGTGAVAAEFARMIDGDDEVRSLAAEVTPGEQLEFRLVALRREPLTAWRYSAAPVAESVGTVEDGVIVPLFASGDAHIFPADQLGEFDDVILDDAGDLFHGDPSIVPVRQDGTVDTLAWGAGLLVQDAGTATAVPGIEGGAFTCDEPSPGDDFLVLCGSNAPAPGTHVAVWNCLTAPVPLNDPSTVRTYWTMFQDGDPANDFKALPRFANDVLGDTDTQYWVEWRDAGWSLRRTSGPDLAESPTAAWAVISGECVTVMVPESELAGSDATSVGVAGYSGPVAAPFGAQATSDRAPGAQQPLLPLADATQWMLPYGVLVRTDAAPVGTSTVQSDDGAARLIVPDGALPDGVALADISVTRMALDAIPIGFDDTTPVAAYHLQPDGLRLSSPATLEMLIESPGDTIPMVVHLGEHELDFPDVSTEILDDGRVAVRVPVAAFSRWVVSSDGWFAAKVDDPSDHMVGDSFQVSASVRKNRGVVRYDIGEYYSELDSVVAGLMDPWQYRGTMMNPTFIEPGWLYPAPALTSVRGGTASYQGTVTCASPGRGGPIYTAGFVFTLEELHTTRRGTFLFKTRVRKSTGVTARSRMFECQAPPTPTPSATPTPETADNAPPEVSAVRAALLKPVTIYGVEATDADGDRLTFTWSRSRAACRKFQHGSTLPTFTDDQVAAARQTIPNASADATTSASLALWLHPGELCPHDVGTSHEGTVTVKVTDGVHIVTRTYKGTDSGQGASD